MAKRSTYAQELISNAPFPAELISNAPFPAELISNAPFAYFRVSSLAVRVPASPRVYLGVRNAERCVPGVLNRIAIGNANNCTITVRFQSLTRMALAFRERLGNAGTRRSHTRSGDHHAGTPAACLNVN